MKSRMLIILLFSLMFPLAETTTAKDWRGIVPLRSTRADVERLLGPGTTACKCAYYLDDVNVFFVYSSGDCKSGGSGGWDIPPDTVIRFSIYPKPNPRLSDLNIDESKFKKSQTGHIEGFVNYINEEEGFSLEVYEGMVRSFGYEPAARDIYLRCPNYQDLSFPSDIPKELRPRLIERLEQFVEYTRTKQYEKQYELFLPEFARLMFSVKSKEEFAELFRKIGDFKGPWIAYGGPWIEFRPGSIMMMEDKTYGKVYSIYGRAKTLEDGKIVESTRETKAVIKNGEWYFVDIFRLAY